MNTQEVANKLVAYCRSGQYQQAQNELYHPNAISIEPAGTPVERVEGLEGIRQKARQWEEMVEEMHSAEVSEPVVAGNFFTLTMKNEATFKGMGRQKLEEVCVYEVSNDGKIVKEQFFYTPAPMGQQG